MLIIAWRNSERENLDHNMASNQNCTGEACHAHWDSCQQPPTLMMEIRSVGTSMLQWPMIRMMQEAWESRAHCSQSPLRGDKLIDIAP